MNTHEFIVKNVREQLERNGIAAGIAFICSREALNYYNKTARFKRNAFDDCLKFAKKKAKEMSA